MISTDFGWRRVVWINGRKTSTLKLSNTGLTVLLYRIKIWQLDENDHWTVEDDWKVRTSCQFTSLFKTSLKPTSRARPMMHQFQKSAGHIQSSALSSHLRTVKIWDQTTISISDAQQSSSTNGGQNQQSGSSPLSSRWVEKTSVAGCEGDCPSR